MYITQDSALSKTLICKKWKPIFASIISSIMKLELTNRENNKRITANECILKFYHTVVQEQRDTNLP